MVVRPVKRRHRTVADECEAFVHGHYADCAIARVGDEPWVQLNRLAHGSFDDLGNFVARHRRGTRATAADVDVARVLLARAPTPEDLRQVQREVLLPLEELLDDLARDGARLHPREVTWIVLSALQGWPAPRPVHAA